MEMIIMAVAIVTLVFSTLALIVSVACYIQWKAAELSKYEFVQVPQSELFETDINKINQEIEDDELDEELTQVLEPNKPFNEVIL